MLKKKNIFSGVDFKVVQISADTRGGGGGLAKVSSKKVNGD